MKITRAYKFRLRPSYEDKIAFWRASEAARYAWNWTLALIESENVGALVDAGVLDRADLDACIKRKQRVAVVARARALAKQRGIKIETPPINRGRLYKAFSTHRDTEMPSLQHVHSHTYGYAIERVVNAYKAWWKALKSGRRGGAPRFKPRGTHVGIHDGFTIQINARMLGSGRLRIPGVGWVKTRRNPIGMISSGTPCSVTVTRTADSWCASVAVKDVEIADPETPPRPPVGVDLGVNALVTTSCDGEIERIEPPRPLEHALMRLAKLQRQHKRKKKGSRRQYQSQMKVARLHARVAEMRADFLHRLSHDLTKNHRTIVVEGFDIHALVEYAVDRGPGTNEHKTERRRNVLDGAWGELRRQLVYKGSWYASDVLVLDKHDPTDQQCHRCGERNKMPPTTSDYACISCGLQTTRQENTARLLEDFGRGNPPESTGGDPGTDARGPDGSAPSVQPAGQGRVSGKKRERPRSEPGAGLSDGSSPFFDRSLALARKTEDRPRRKERDSARGRDSDATKRKRCSA